MRNWKSSFGERSDHRYSQAHLTQSFLHLKITLVCSNNGSVVSILAVWSNRRLFSTHDLLETNLKEIVWLDLPLNTSSDQISAFRCFSASLDVANTEALLLWVGIGEKRVSFWSMLQSKRRIFTIVDSRAIEHQSSAACEARIRSIPNWKLTASSNFWIGQVRRSPSGLVGWKCCWGFAWGKLWGQRIQKRSWRILRKPGWVCSSIKGRWETTLTHNTFFLVSLQLWLVVGITYFSPDSLIQAPVINGIVHPEHPRR